MSAHGLERFGNCLLLISALQADRSGKNNTENNNRKSRLKMYSSIADPFIWLQAIVYKNSGRVSTFIYTCPNDTRLFISTFYNIANLFCWQECNHGFITLEPLNPEPLQR